MQTQMHNTETSRKRAIEVEVGELNEGMWVHFSFHSEVGLDGTERNRKFLRTTLLLAELEVSLRCPPCMFANNVHAVARTLMMMMRYIVSKICLSRCSDGLN